MKLTKSAGRGKGKSLETQRRDMALRTEMEKSLMNVRGIHGAREMLDGESLIRFDREGLRFELTARVGPAKRQRNKKPTPL